MVKCSQSPKMPDLSWCSVVSLKRTFSFYYWGYCREKNKWKVLLSFMIFPDIQPRCAWHRTTKYNTINAGGQFVLYIFLGQSSSDRAGMQGNAAWRTLQHQALIAAFSCDDSEIKENILLVGLCLFEAHWSFYLGSCSNSAESKVPLIQMNKVTMNVVKPSLSLWRKKKKKINV